MILDTNTDTHITHARAPTVLSWYYVQGCGSMVGCRKGLRCFTWVSGTVTGRNARQWKSGMHRLGWIGMISIKCWKRSVVTGSCHVLLFSPSAVCVLLGKGTS